MKGLNHTVKNAKSIQKIESSYFELGRLHAPGEITIKMITEKAGIARSTFYSYYENLEEMTHHLETELLVPFLKIIRNEKKTDPFLETVTYFRKHTDEILLLRYAKNSTLISKLSSIISRELERQKYIYHFSCNEYQSFFLTCVLLSVIIPTPGTPEGSLEQMSTELRRHFISTLFPYGPQTAAGSSF